MSTFTKSKTLKIVAVVAVFGVLFFGGFKVAKALTQSEVTAICALFNCSASQQAAMQALVTTSTPSTSTFSVSATEMSGLSKVAKGSTGASALAWQTFLNDAGASPALVLDGNFGTKSVVALKAWQASQSLGADGIAGGMSRAAASAQIANATVVVASCFAPNTLVGGVCTAPITGCVAPQVLNSVTNVCESPVVVTGAVSVALASDNPASSVIATGTAFNPVLKFNITNGTANQVKVTGIKLTKSGFYANTYVSGVSVYTSDGVRHGNVVTTLGVDGVANMTFLTDPITIDAGKSETALVRINIATTANTGTISFNVNSASDITLDSGSASGTLPIVGNLNSLVDGTSSLATVTASVQAVNAAGANYNADANAAQEITKFRIAETSSNEDVKLHGLTLWNNGNTATTDYKDVELVDQTGVVLATAQPVGQNIKFSLATPFTLVKGQTKDFTIRAKIIAGASRTIQFVIYNDYDLDVRGANTGAGLLASAVTGGCATDTTFPVGDATTTCNKVTVNSGTLVFNRAADSASASVAPGATDIVLAKYNAKPVGENMELRQVSFGLDQDTSSVALTGTVLLKVNGATVYSAAANTTNFPVVGTASTRTLSSYPILSAGVDNTIEVVVSVSSSATSSDAYFVNDMDVTSVRRLLTNDIIDPGVSVSDGLTRQVQAGKLAITTLSVPVTTSVVPGTNTFELANIELNAIGSGENVRVTTVVVTDTLGAGTDFSGMTNLIMKDSTGNVLTTTSSTATNAATVSFNFVNAVEVTQNTSAVLKLYGDVISATGTSHTYKVAAVGDVTANGKSTGNTLGTSQKTVAGSGQLMTVATAGTLTASAVTGSGATPTIAQNVNINTMDGVYLAFRLTSQYEAQKITSLQLRASGTALTQNNLKNIRLYAQSGTGSLQGSTTAFATANQFDTCSSNTCFNTWTAADNLLPMTVNPGTPVTVFVKADVAGENIAKLGNDFLFSLAANTAQVSTGTVTSTVGTASVIINGTTISTPFVTDQNTTTANLRTAINASSQASVVTATGATNSLIVTSDTAGLPFTMTDNSSGGSTIAIVATTANGGIVAKGSVSGSAPTYAGSANTSGTANNITPFNVVVSGEYPTSGITTAVTAGTQLARFKVTNNGSAPVTLTTVKFTDSGTNLAAGELYKLWASGENSNDYLNTALKASDVNVDFDAMTSVAINGGSYRYLTVELQTVGAAPAAAAGDNWNLSVAALGDLKYSVAESNLGYDGEQDGDLTGTISALLVNGTPAVSTISKQ